MQQNKDTITNMLKSVSAGCGVPLSTLKLNAGILKRIGLIDYGNSHPAKLTESGKHVIRIIAGRAVSGAI